MSTSVLEQVALCLLEVVDDIEGPVTTGDVVAGAATTDMSLDIEDLREIFPFEDSWEIFLDNDLRRILPDNDLRVIFPADNDS